MLTFRHFEDLANGLLGRCSEIDIEFTENLIQHKHKNWGNKTIMELAALSDSKQFLSHIRCKDAMDARWRGNISLGSRGFFNLKVMRSSLLHEASTSLSFR